MIIRLDKKENSYHTIACWVLTKLDVVRYIRQKKAQLFQTVLITNVKHHPLLISWELPTT